MGWSFTVMECWEVKEEEKLKMGTEPCVGGARANVPRPNTMTP
jgi:hypothetical protein